MKKQTNLKAIKTIAKLFLHLPLEVTEFVSILQHPVYNTPIQVDDGKMVNILEDKEALDRMNKLYEAQIDKADDVNRLLLIIRTPYWLTFLKHIKPYLSKNDFDKMLGDIWVQSENPNGDVNVSVRTSASYFRRANKKILMTPEEMEVYDSLPDTLTVYRGVSPGRVENGLSWTANKEKALWFAKRFRSRGRNGVLLSGTVRKKDVLAYLNRRSEDELVIYPKDIKNLTKEVIYGRE